MEEYAVWYVTDDGEWDRSPIAIFNSWDEADNYAEVMSSRYPEMAKQGSFIACEL